MIRIVVCIFIISISIESYAENVCEFFLSSKGTVNYYEVRMGLNGKLINNYNNHCTLSKESNERTEIHQIEEHYFKGKILGKNWITYNCNKMEVRRRKIISYLSGEKIEDQIIMKLPQKNKTASWKHIETPGKEVYEYNSEFASLELFNKKYDCIKVTQKIFLGKNGKLNRRMSVIYYYARGYGLIEQYCIKNDGSKCKSIHLLVGCNKDGKEYIFDSESQYSKNDNLLKKRNYNIGIITQIDPAVHGLWKALAISEDGGKTEEKM
ncbi:MAG: hypothetical protein ACFFG0_53195, partial [Candidatus Thorarchaeota archaeon]